MIVLVRETQGDTLRGAVDGQNTLFGTSYPMAFEYLGVYLNGRLKVASLDDGYTVVDALTVQFKEPPQVGDTVEIEYQLQAGPSGGGAPGGVPSAPQARNIAPAVQGARAVYGPQAVVAYLRPSAGGGESLEGPQVLPQNLRPRLSSKPK